MPVKPKPVAERFWPKVQITGFCWEWTASKNVGYGRISIANGVWRLAHRVAYEMLVGPIPDGIALDHLCRNRACVNPDHLEPVTIGENNRRGYGWPGRKARQTHCVNGHELAGDNLHRDPSRPTSRRCVTCMKATEARRVRRALEPGEEFVGECIRGHDFTPDNTYVSPDRTKRQCRICARAIEARRNRRAAA